MDMVSVIAEIKIREAIEQGLFDSLPTKGRIDCSHHDERFVEAWFREHRVGNAFHPAGGKE